MITIDTQSSVPLEDQIRDAIRLVIARNEVAPGDQLPSVRQLANDLGIHWNTVARAYRRLRDEGLLAVGRGRRVTVRDKAASQEEFTRASQQVRSQFRAALAEGCIAGMTLQQLENVLHDELANWNNTESALDPS